MRPSCRVGDSTHAMSAQKEEYVARAVDMLGRHVFVGGLQWLYFLRNWQQRRNACLVFRGLGLGCSFRKSQQDLSCGTPSNCCIWNGSYGFGVNHNHSAGHNHWIQM